MRKGFWPYRKPKPVVCIETGQEFKSISDAAILIHADQSGLAKAIRAGKKLKGYTFKLVERKVLPQ